METRGMPFVFGGVKNVDDCKTAEEVIEKAGLNWDVRKAEIFAKIPNAKTICPGGIFTDSGAYNPVENMYATYRSDTGQPLGIVKGRYEPVQNRDAFKFFDVYIKSEFDIVYFDSIINNEIKKKKVQEE
mgnify:CR=1 FL=1